jgi:AAA+ superfamily predicted ATPase
VTELFEEVLNLPDPDAERRYRSLVGLDAVQGRLEKEGEILLDPDLLEEWSFRVHGRVVPAVTGLLGRPPLFLFGGDVGTGKTTLAETFGDPIARARRIDILVYRLSLRTRGAGAVGEMTDLITKAFDQLRAEAAKAKKAGHILVIDEADALAQSRDLDQMHHEDRAGVNALIRGIDQAKGDRSRLIVVMCSNRIDAIDPAVRRRAAGEFSFDRPDLAQRREVLCQQLAATGISGEEVERLAEKTGDAGRGYGYTYSDLIDRVVPSATLLAYPHNPITAAIVEQAIADNPPTKPFGATE